MPRVRVTAYGPRRERGSSAIGGFSGSVRGGECVRKLDKTTTGAMVDYVPAPCGRERFGMMTNYVLITVWGSVGSVRQ